MKIGIMFANSGPFSSPERFGHLAQTAERCGIESIWTVEHVVIPEGYKSAYPYSSSGKIPGSEDVPIPDPLLPLAYAAALTTKIKLATGVVILPQRHPLYVAKELATLDVLSHGRVIFGVGSGWLREEFESLGLDFDSRGSCTDEAIQAIRVLWRESSSRFAGKHFNFGPVKSFPKPVQKGGIPVHIGGHSRPAARRAARLGDGFFPMEPDAGKLARVLGLMKEECAKIGRNPAEIELTAFGKPSLDVIDRYRDMGVSRLVIGPPAWDAEGLTRGLEKIAAEVLPKL